MLKRELQSRQALYVAEGGIEWAKAHLQENPGLRRGDLSLDTGQATIVIVSSSGRYQVISEGHSGFAVRKIEETLQLEEGKWSSISYKELHK
ncbi:hypothetical protein [Desulfosporosinus sp. SB140]|uniref:hypothetical protein n=1 Tax=Desulfosporosinus paludis TaxID=3115649 RepID=UPI00388D9C04